MHVFAWSKTAINYLKDNQGLINDLELAFADFRNTKDGMPTEGSVDKKLGLNYYLWEIHGHAVIFRTGTAQGQPKVWIDVIKPIEYEDE